MSYTNEQVDYMKRVYKENPCRETVDLLAKEMDKGYRSIIGKLSKEGVYRREVYKTKTGEMPITKAELVIMIANTIGLDSEKLNGLDKSPKLALKALHKGLEETSEWEG